MSQILCRQCGHRSDRKDFPTGEFRCPWCDWREILQQLKEKAPAKPRVSTETAAPVADALIPEQTIADVDSLREMPAREFVHWCGRLFERFGYVVKHIEEADQDCDLRLSRHDEITLVDCKICSEGRSVIRSECQTLVGAMVGSQVKRGVIITTGAFDPSCHDYAASLQGMKLDLVDGKELMQTHRALTSPPLAKWFGIAA